MRDLKLESFCKLSHHTASGQGSHTCLSPKTAFLGLNISPTDWLLPEYLKARVSMQITMLLSRFIQSGPVWPDPQIYSTNKLSK